MNRSLPLLAFAACGMIWGTTFLFIRMGNDTLPALWACSLRLSFAALLLNGILWVTKTPWPRGPALKAAVLFGFWEFGINFPLLYWGEKVVPSGLAAVFFAVCPIVAIFLAWAYGAERLNVAKVGAGLLAFAGVGVIFWKEVLQGGSAAGLIAIFVAAAVAPIAGLMLQRGPKQSAISTNAVGTLVGLPFALVASLALGEKMVIPTTAAEILPIAYLVVAGSLGAFVLFAWLLNHWKVSSAAFLGVVCPVIAVIVGAVVRHEALTSASLIGAACVLVGVTIALRSEAVEQAAEPVVEPA